MRRTCSGMLGLLLLGACGDSGFKEDYMDDQPPSGSCETDGLDPECMGSTGTTAATSTTTGTGTGGGDACKASSDCPMGQMCGADFDGNNRGPFMCVDDCIVDMDDAKWCADASACCSADAACTDRGYCVSGGGDTGTGTSTGTSTSTSG